MCVYTVCPYGLRKVNNALEVLMFWKTVIDNAKLKILKFKIVMMVVSSTDDGTNQPFCTPSWFTNSNEGKFVLFCFVLFCFQLSTPCDGHRYQVMVIIYWKCSPIQTIPPNLYGRITLNNRIESMTKYHLKRDMHTGNQIESNDAT